jgi:hypothetical protein
MRIALSFPPDSGPAGYTNGYPKLPGGFCPGARPFRHLPRTVPGF